MSRPIVIDVGCATHGGDQSLQTLVDELNPLEIWGFDPAARDRGYVVGETTIIESTSAAWIFDGLIGFKIASLGGHVTAKEPATTPCIDLARFILDMQIPPHTPLIVKMDCEGAEYELVPHLASTGADLKIDMLMIEWHCDGCGYGIWNWDDPHPDGCKANQEMWRVRRAATEALVKCPTGGWSQ